jgi:aryl-alcohol dehydrogenase-like predicted oxidoreductase
MEHRTLGTSGVKVSPLCLGAMNFGGPTPEDEAFRIIDRALARTGCRYQYCRYSQYLQCRPERARRG